MGLGDLIIYHFLGSFEKLRETTICFFMSVCTSVRPSACNNSVPHAQIFMQLDIRVFFEKKVEIIQTPLKYDNYNG